MISNVDIQRLKDAILIEDIVRHEGVSLTEKGAKLYGLCPFHDDHHPSLVITPARNQYYCPVCNEHGDAISFVMKLRGVSYIEALKLIAPIYNIELREEASSVTDSKDRQREEWIRNMRTQTLTLSLQAFHDKGNEAHKYMASRGFTDETLKTYQVGYLPMSTEWVANMGFLMQFYEAKSLQGRIIFPWFSTSNQLVALAGRVLDPRTKGLEKKYLNSSFNKGNYFYGWSQAIVSMRKTGTVYIVEGYTDVMAMHQAGVLNTIAQCGTAMTDRHAYLLASSVKKVILCLDNDSAGVIAMESIAHKLLPYNLQVEILLSSECKDPADMLIDYGESYIQEWAQHETHNLLDICIHKIIATPIEQTFVVNARIRQLLEYLSLISDDIIRGLYIAKVNKMIPSLSLEVLNMGVEKKGK